MKDHDTGPSLPQGETVRLATHNCRTLSGKLPALFALFAEHQLDVLCLQETQVRPDALAALRADAQKEGLTLLAEPLPPLHQDLKQNLHSRADDKYQEGDEFTEQKGGLLVLARWPVDSGPTLQCEATPGRQQFFRLHRPGQRPIWVVNIHLEAPGRAGPYSTGPERGHLVANTLGATGEQFIMIGDWNELPDWGAAGDLQATGRLHCADEISTTPVVKTRNVERGRYIDYALHTGDLAFGSREQHPGLQGSDHDLIVYSLHVAPLEASWKRAPFTRCTADIVTEENWHSAWAPSEGRFRRRCARGDIEGAWALLTCVAEGCLLGGDTPPHPRGGAKVKIVSKSSTTRVKGDQAQSTAERKLRRWLRRAQEMLTSPTWRLSDKWEVYVASTPYEELRQVQWGTQAAVDALQARADHQAASDAKARLDNWHVAMHTDMAAARRWVLKETSAVAPAGRDDPVHPQLRAEYAKDKWKDIWAPKAPPKTWPELKPFVQGMAQPRVKAPKVYVSGPALQGRAQEARTKAAGPDGWEAEQLLKLPPPFWETLAVLWNEALRVGRLPQAWANVRVALIPKEDGGERPLGIASVMWRLGMTVLIRQLTEWVDAWLPNELAGGLHGRSPDDIHEAFITALRDSRAQGHGAWGLKIDIKKCFDSVSPDQAIGALEHFGGPPALCAILRDFYAHSVRVVEWRGATARHPITCTRSLLQGCPASPLLLAGLMSIWLHQVQKAAPKVRVGIYLDDRTFWGTETTIEQVKAALDAALEVDTALGLEWHPDKGACAATSKKARLRIHTLCGTRVGKLVSSWTLLGVRYSFTKRRLCADTKKHQERIKRRLRRIYRVARIPTLRKALVRTTVLPIITWLGAWSRPTKRQLVTYQRQVEVAVNEWNHQNRSRYLLWTEDLGPKLDPAHVLDLAALNYERRRAARRATNRVAEAHRLKTRPLAAPPVEGTASRFSEVAAKWGWTKTENMAEDEWATPEGDLRLTWDSWAVVNALAEEGWRRALWAVEPRADHGPLGTCTMTKAWELDYGETFAPVTAGHACWFKGNYRARQVAFAAAPAGHERAGVAGRDLECKCGVVNPTRHHLTWECPEAAQELTDLKVTPGPRHSAEERLLVPLAPLPPRALRRPLRTKVARLANRIAKLARAQPDGNRRPVLVATDGGSVGKVQRWRRAGWGVAISGYREGGRVPGVDQTPGMAERWALWVAVAAVNMAAVPCLIISDNRACVDGFRATRGGLPPTKAAAYWADLFANDNTRWVTSVEWVPAHGRHPTWSPPDGHMSYSNAASGAPPAGPMSYSYDASGAPHAGPMSDSNAATWRALNDAADIDASSAAKAGFEELEHLRELWAKAQRWEEAALARQEAATSWFRELHEVLPPCEVGGGRRLRGREFTLVGQGPHGPLGLRR